MKCQALFLLKKKKIKLLYNLKISHWLRAVFSPVNITDVHRLGFFSPLILFVLKFYCPVNPMGSCRVQSVYLTTRLLFVCVEVLWPSQPNGVMSSALSLPNHTFTGQA